MLNEAELQTLSRFCFERDKHSYLVTRALVRVALSRYCDVSPEKWRFSRNAFGRPAIKNRDSIATRMRFNVSHTAGLIALAVTLDRELGVDAEKVDRDVDYVALAGRCFAAEEVAALAALSLPEQPRRFFEYWTLKESYVKALGTGLSMPLDRMCFRFPGDHGISAELAQGIIGDRREWRFWLLHPSSAHTVAICAGASGWSELRLSCRRTVPLRNEELVAVRIARRTK